MFNVLHRGSQVRCVLGVHPIEKAVGKPCEFSAIVLTTVGIFGILICVINIKSMGVGACNLSQATSNQRLIDVA